MLSIKEKERLKNHDLLSPKERAKLHYHIAQKVKSKLSELAEINEALCSLPEKNAKRILCDEMIASILMLTENMIKILRYAPVEKGPRGQIFVCVSEEMPSKDRNSQKFEVERRPPTQIDVARHLLLEEHIKAIHKFTRPFAAALEGPLAELPHLNSRFVQEGHELYKKWRPDPEEAGLAMEDQELDKGTGDLLNSIHIGEKI